MLSRLKIKNIALIDELEIEFGDGLNLLTGETGSGKSIIVDSLGALTGDRVSSDLIKEGTAGGQIEGLFAVAASASLTETLTEAGIEFDEGDEIDVIVRRELSAAGKNRIFINGQMVTQGLLRRVGSSFVDIHGQGEQAALYDVATHITMLDQFARNADLRAAVAAVFAEWRAVRSELDELERDDASKLQLVDILRFQVAEIGRAALHIGEDTELEEEKRRLNNAEKLSALSEEAYLLLYENEDSTLATLERAARKIDELGQFDAGFREFDEGVRSAQAILQEAAFAARDFRHHLEFSPEHLAEIEDRLAEISRLKRKYGDSVEAVLAHLAESEARLESIETSDFRAQKLRERLGEIRTQYIAAARKLNEARTDAARKFELAVQKELKDVALEKARFEVRISTPAADELDGTDADSAFTANGYDSVEFYFSANPGESPRPLGKVASGGEASRLMLVIKTTARLGDGEKSAVFDEIDIGIGGRVAEAVGRKLKDLSRFQQVMCVTHQPQIASLADVHFVVEKSIAHDRTTIAIRELGPAERVEEIARMLAGEQITEQARENARAMLASAGTR